MTVNAVAPGPIETELFRAGHPEGSDAEKKALSSIPMGRFGAPADVAAAVNFLLSNEAGFITGKVLGVDGGGSLARRERYAGRVSVQEEGKGDGEGKGG